VISKHQTSVVWIIPHDMRHTVSRQPCRRNFLRVQQCLWHGNCGTRSMLNIFS
jgi:hypothetical protein